MLKNTSLFVLILSLALAFSTRVSAQEESAENAPKKNYEYVDVEIKVLRWAYSNAMRVSEDMGKLSSKKANEDPDFWYFTGKDYKKLDTSSGGLSRPFKYKGSQRMAFYKRTVKEDKNGNPNGYTYKEVANMMIPLGVNEVFVLMQSRGNSASFYPMNVSPKQLPKDKIAVMNMTQHNIALLVGGVAKLLRANSHEIFKPKSKKESSVEVQMARMIDKKWRPIYRNNISVPDGERCIMLVFDPYNTKNPKFNVRIITL